MPRLILFLDLDDTILQTAPKCPSGQPMIPAALDRAGQALSFMTPAQQQLLAIWQQQATVIPVTGRTDDALARVLIPFSSWRISHHGAVIRQPDGQLPHWWLEEIGSILAAAQPALQAIAEPLEAGLAAGGYRFRIHTVQGLITYISVKSDDEGAALSRLRAQLEAEGLPSGLALHHNGNNLSLMAVGAQKQDAVRRLIRELAREEPIISVGAGDSLTDIPFLRICDFALVPKASQIQRETWNAYPA